MNQGTIKKAYETFWGLAGTHFRAGGVTARAHFAVERLNTTSIAIDTICYLSGCRWKPKSNKPLEVLLRSSETYVTSTREMSASTVRVSYLRRQGNDAVTLLPVHYDFDQTVGADHPVFHAQLGSYVFTEQELERVSFRGTIAPVDDEPFGNVRIPTACMNFGSTLLSLTADHCPAKTFTKVIQALRASELVKWNAQCPSLQQGVVTGSFFPSHHWYAS